LGGGFKPTPLELRFFYFFAFVPENKFSNIGAGEISCAELCWGGASNQHRLSCAFFIFLPLFLKTSFRTGKKIKNTTSW